MIDLIVEGHLGPCSFFLTITGTKNYEKALHTIYEIIKLRSTKTKMRKDQHKVDCHRYVH